MIERRCGEFGRGFSEKTNPNRPVFGCGTTPGARGENGSYPEKCNPRARRSPLTEEQRQLVSRYLPLAKAMVRRARYPGLEREELQSSAYMALVEAAQTFDPAKNVNFATFARLRIRGALSDFRRSWLRICRSRTGRRSPMFRRLSTHDELQGEVLAEMASPSDGYDIDEIEEIEFYFRRLPKPQASACRLIYLDGKSQDEAAALLGYSKSYLSRLHRDALESLSREYKDIPTLQKKEGVETWN